MTYVEQPQSWHTGVYQLRPALLGWQYRMRLYGLTWEPWRFVLGRERRARERIATHLGRGFTEVPYSKGSVDV